MISCPQPTLQFSLPEVDGRMRMSCPLSPAVTLLSHELGFEYVVYAEIALAASSAQVSASCLLLIAVRLELLTISSFYAAFIAEELLTWQGGEVSRWTMK